LRPRFGSRVLPSPTLRSISMGRSLRPRFGSGVLPSPTLRSISMGRSLRPRFGSGVLPSPTLRSMTTATYDELSVGDEAPALVIEKLSRTNFVRYAGASGDFNPMHHDDTIASSVG